MLKNAVKQKLKEGKSLLGLVSSTASSEITEIFGISGFDFIIFDFEHGTMSYETLGELVRAAKIRNLTPFARVPESNPKLILKVLDAGCLGIMVPAVESKEEAERIVASTIYPPKGIRGVNWKTVANDYGKGNPVDYMTSANKEILRIIQIETEIGVKNIEELVKVEGVDVFMIGASDLSASMGYPGNPGHKKVQEAISEVLKVTQEACVIVGGAVNADKVKMVELQKKGMRLFFVDSPDFIRKLSTQHVKDIKETFISP